MTSLQIGRINLNPHFTDFSPECRLIYATRCLRPQPRVTVPPRSRGPPTRAAGEAGTAAPRPAAWQAAAPGLTSLTRRAGASSRDRHVTRRICPDSKKTWPEMCPSFNAKQEWVSDFVLFTFKLERNQILFFSSHNPFVK